MALNKIEILAKTNRLDAEEEEEDDDEDGE